MRISKKLREEAAQLCSAMASRWALGFDHLDIDQVQMALRCDVERPSRAACDVATRRLLIPEFRRKTRKWHAPFKPFAIAWAEAEAMLRTGWSP